MDKPVLVTTNLNAYAKEACRVAREHFFVTPSNISSQELDDVTAYGGEVGPPDAALAWLLRSMGPLGEAVAAIRKGRLWDAQAQIRNACDLMLDLAADFTNNMVEYSLNNQTLTATKLMLMVSEILEAGYAVALGLEDEYQEELADLVIRVADLVGAQGIDIDLHIARKHQVNVDRPPKHGKQA